MPGKLVRTQYSFVHLYIIIAFARESTDWNDGIDIYWGEWGRGSFRAIHILHLLLVVVKYSHDTFKPLLYMCNNMFWNGFRTYTVFCRAAEKEKVKVTHRSMRLVNPLNSLILHWLFSAGAFMFAAARPTLRLRAAMPYFGLVVEGTYASATCHDYSAIGHLLLLFRPDSMGNPITLRYACVGTVNWALWPGLAAHRAARTSTPRNIIKPSCCLCFILLHSFGGS